MFRIHTYSNSVKRDFDFFIQAKGQNAGKPLSVPTANCFGVKVNPSILVPGYLFYVVQFLHSSGQFSAFIKGSVVPFVTISDVQLVITRFFISR